jgi:hypothetical protein
MARTERGIQKSKWQSAIVLIGQFATFVSSYAGFARIISLFQTIETPFT